MPYTQVSNLEFTEIKTALKEYLRAQTDFTDFDFEGSVWSNLLDVLAYNTYYTAFNTNLVVNELFLSSATLRDNVVALAKQIGYKPKSVVAPSAAVDFTVNFPGAAPDDIILRRGTGFVTTFDDTLYRYVAIENYKAPVIGGVANFDDVKLYEGSVVTDFYTVDTTLTNQRFVLKNPKVDIDTIVIKVYPSNTSTAFTYYERSVNILNSTPTSTVFYLDEIEDERYEIFFGDGVLGRKLEDQEYVEISYLVTNGTASNGARTFTFSGILEDVNGNTGFTTDITNIVTESAAAGGEEMEDIASIKFNAPKYFGTQDRAVTSDDYGSIVRKIYPAVADIIIFGGEEADPPEYGKVKIVIKPDAGAYLSSFTKKEIVKELRQYSVASVTPEIIDPSILTIELKSDVYYDTRKTTARPEEIKSKVISSLESYIAGSDTEKFNGKFRYSKFVAAIDDADRSINSNITEVFMRKDFYPQINSKSYYEICFKNAFDKECEGPTVSSTGFIIQQFPNTTVYLEDSDGTMVLYKLDTLTGKKVVVNNSIGTVNYDEGEIVLNDLTIIKGSFFDERISLKVKPLSNDVVATREVYLDVDIQSSKFIAYQE